MNTGKERSFAIINTRKSSRVNQEAHTRDSKQRSRRSHCRRRKERGWILWVIEILCTNLLLCSRQWRFHVRRPQMTNNGQSLWKLQRGKNEKLKSKQEVIDEAMQACKTVHFANAHGIMPLQNHRIGKQCQTYKGRVVLRGDAVNNDSGSYAVFTE